MAIRRTDIARRGAADRREHRVAAGGHLPSASGQPSTPTAPSWSSAGGLLAHLRLILRFGLVGGSGILVNSGVLYALVAGLHWHQLPAAAVATETAIVTNFVLNDRWTFRDAAARTRWLGRLWRYNLVALGGLLISLAVLAVLSMGLGVHYLLANLVGIAAATLWNYGVNLRVTWALRGGVAAPARGHPVDAIDEKQEMSALEDE
jgi:putative flippase GtrA